MAVQGTYIDIAFNTHRGRLLLPTIPDDLGRDEYESDLRVLEKDKWGSIYLEGLLMRSCASHLKTWLVGREGEVWTLQQGQDRLKEQLPDSGHTDGRRLGPPNQIRRIADQLYVCGFSGQVYTQDAKGGWVHMDHGLVEPGPMTSKSLSLEAIAGTGPDNIFVCGSRATLAHWNGKKWAKIPLLTGVNLWNLRCFAKDNVCVVGDDGVVIRGDGKKQWHIDQIPGHDDPLMDVELYRGKIYAAGVHTLYVLEDENWKPVKHGLPKAKTDFYALTVGGERLWAMGTHRICSFDGKKWQSHIDPDNG